MPRVRLEAAIGLARDPLSSGGRGRNLHPGKAGRRAERGILRRRLSELLLPEALMEDRTPRTPSMAEELMGRTRHFLSGMVTDYLKGSFEEIAQWILGRSLRYALSAALFMMAAAFLFLGGSEGLI